MSTKYFLYTQDKTIIQKYGLQYELTDIPYLSYEVYLARISVGWIPLFQEHQHLSDIQTLLQLIQEDNVEIYDEYQQYISEEEFKIKVIGWESSVNNKRRVQQPTADAKHFFTDKYGYEFLRITT